MSDISGIPRGDNINLEATFDGNITNWKIRCEIYDDCGNCIKLATANSGGSNDQIEITDAVNGVFIIKVAKNQTTKFDNKSFIEIEMESDTGEVNTPHQGELNFKDERITWETPNS